MARRPSGPSAVRVEGLDEFRRELRALGKEWPRELAKVHRKVAQDVAQVARGKARALGGVQAKAAGAIKGYGSQTAARVGINPGKSNPMANVAFWGAKGRSGWYAARRYEESPPQHPSWVGNTWDVGRRDQGPYAINPAIADQLDEIVEAFGDGIDDLTRRAFPDR